MQGFIAAMATSICLSFGSRVVMRCSCKPGADRILVKVLVCRPAGG